MYKPAFPGQAIRLVSGGRDELQSIELLALVQCADFAHAYLVEHPLLLGYLERPDIWQHAFDTDPEHLSQLATLFGSSSGRLFESFATNVAFAECFFSPIKKLLDPGYAAVAESLTRLSVRAFEQRPKEMAETLYISETIYNDLLRNLSFPITWQILQSFIVKHPLDTIVAIWLLFTCLSGSEIPEQEKRMLRLVHWIHKRPAPDLIPFRDSVRRTVAYNLLGEFFSHTGGETDELRKCFLKHLPDFREISEGRSCHTAFALAKTLVLGLTERGSLDSLTQPLIAKAKKVLQRAESPNFPDAAACLDFLTACVAGLKAEDVVSVLAKIMLPNELTEDIAVATDFAVRSGVALVERAVKGIYGWDATRFRRPIEEIVLKCLNSHGSHHLALATACLDILALVRSESGAKSDG
jgi:hypothetical protein